MNSRIAYQMQRGGILAVRAGKRRGFAAVIALIFLAICAAMAAGLFSLTQSSTAITGNERRIASAQAAMETGMQYYQYQIDKAMADVTSGPTAGTMDDWMGDFVPKLGSLVDGHNGAAGTVAAGTDASGNVCINAPGIAFGTNTSFQARISRDADGTGLLLEVTGTCTDTTASLATATRTARVAFAVTPRSSGAPVQLPLVTRGEIRDATNVNRTGRKGLSYDPTAVDFTDGSSGEALLYPDMSPIEGKVPFPDNDSLIEAVGALHLPEATVTITGSRSRIAKLNGTASSVRLPVRDMPYVLTGTINGIVYVEWPNNIELSGNVTLNGTIVFERKGTSGGTSTITLVRDGWIERTMETAQTNIMSITPSFTRQADVKWYSIIAPDADLELGNGTVWDTTKYFEGSLHINSFSRQGGGSEIGFRVKKGGIVAEGDLYFHSNGSEYLVDPDVSGVSGGEIHDGKATMSWGTYDEIMN